MGTRRKWPEIQKWKVGRMVNRQSLLKRKVPGENIQGDVTEGLEWQINLI